MEKHELSKIDFEIIEDAFKALLQSHPDPVTADKIVDLRDKFRDAYTGWWRLKRLHKADNARPPLPATVVCRSHAQLFCCT